LINRELTLVLILSQILTRFPRSRVSSHDSDSARRNLY